MSAEEQGFYEYVMKIQRKQANKHMNRPMPPLLLNSRQARLLGDRLDSMGIKWVKM